MRRRRGGEDLDRVVDQTICRSLSPSVLFFSAVSPVAAQRSRLEGKRENGSVCLVFLSVLSCLVLSCLSVCCLSVAR